MSTKRVAWTVFHGTKATFMVVDGSEVCGYVAGMDDFHWLVLCPSESGVDEVLVHKASAPRVVLHKESTYEGEPAYDEMEHVIATFRARLAEDINRAPKQPERQPV